MGRRPARPDKAASSNAPNLFNASCWNVAVATDDQYDLGAQSASRAPPLHPPDRTRGREGARVVGKIVT